MTETAYALRGMVTSPHHLASHAGRDILREGGSAIEACVAMAATLAVVYPHMNSIGGDGFWLIAEPDGRVHTIDACGGAAGNADLRLYHGMDTIPWRGPLAANTVAGTVSGWRKALILDGSSLPLARLFRDAIELAKGGAVITRGGAQIAAGKSAELRSLPGAYASIFEPQGKPLQEGDILKQPALAGTLMRLASEGLESFYSGALANAIASDLTALGSPLTIADLAKHNATTPPALSVKLKGVTAYNMSPPSQGAASLLILAMFDRLHAASADEMDHVHGLVEATKRAFQIRDAQIGDPAYMNIDVQALLDDNRAITALTETIDARHAMPWPHTAPPGDTVWFGAVDNRGQIVSCIQSTYFEFGSGLVLPETGIIWQNRGVSFRLASTGWNALKPYRKPFHTLNPAMARFDDGRVMAYGTMGGEGQPQTQAAIFTRYSRFGIPLQEAVTAPRWLLGRTWGDTTMSLKIEDRFSPTLYTELRAAGHDLELVPAFTSIMGHAGALVRHPSGLLEGAFDPRSDGAVAAW